MHRILSGVHREEVRIITDICRYVQYIHIATQQLRIHTLQQNCIFQTNNYKLRIEFEYIYFATKQPKFQFENQPS